MISIRYMQSRLARKVLATALVLMLGTTATVSGAVAVSCENGGPCLGCMRMVHAPDNHRDGHPPVLPGCAADREGSSCSFDSLDSALYRQIAITDTDLRISDISIGQLSGRSQPAAESARRSSLPLHLKPPGLAVPLYLETLSIRC